MAKLKTSTVHLAFIIMYLVGIRTLACGGGCAAWKNWECGGNEKCTCCPIGLLIGGFCWQDHQTIKDDLPRGRCVYHVDCGVKRYCIRIMGGQYGFCLTNINGQIV
ncbi:hypothetical protein Leryth_024528 [Lithospermum erythrorhizon]|nr:hypothetical protein Leryth_024528 [Lithospermum erythrorhizon]